MFISNSFGNTAEDLSRNDTDVWNNITKKASTNVIKTHTELYIAVNFLVIKSFFKLTTHC